VDSELQSVPGRAEVDVDGGRVTVRLSNTWRRAYSGSAALLALDIVSQIAGGGTELRVPGADIESRLAAIETGSCRARCRSRHVGPARRRTTPDSGLRLDSGDLSAVDTGVGYFERMYAPPSRRRSLAMSGIQILLAAILIVTAILLAATTPSWSLGGVVVAILAGIQMVLALVLFLRAWRRTDRGR